MKYIKKVSVEYEDGQIQEWDTAGHVRVHDTHVTVENSDGSKSDKKIRWIGLEAVVL